MTRLSFVLLGVASPGDLIKDPERTPFNIGERVDLADFTEEDLVRDLHVDREIVQSIFQHTSGHPYLTLRVFLYLSEQPLSRNIDSQIEALFIGEEAGKDSNLQFVRDMLIKRAPDREAALAKYSEVWRGKMVQDREADPVAAWLRLSGIVRTNHGRLVVRNAIYYRVFDDVWIRQNRRVNWRRVATYVAAISIGLVFLALSILFPVTYQRNAAIKARDEAEAAQRTANAIGLVAQAQLNQDSQPDRALLLGIEAQHSDNNFETRNGLLRGLQQNPCLLAFLHHRTVVESVAFSADGKLLASTTADKTIRLWDVATRQPLGSPLTGHTGSVNSAASSPDGKLLASASDDKTVRLWDVATRQPLGPLLTGHTGNVNSLAFGPDGKLLASASEDQTVRMWGVATRQQLGAPLIGHTGSVLSVAFSPDGKLLASTSADKAVRLWDVATRRPLGAPLTGHTSSGLGVAFSADSKLLASASANKTVRLWDISARQRLGVPMTGHTNSVLSVAFSADGRQLASASDDKTICLWDVAMRQPLGAPMTGHTSSVRSVTFRSLRLHHRQHIPYTQVTVKLPLFLLRQHPFLRPVRKLLHPRLIARRKSEIQHVSRRFRREFPTLRLNWPRPNRRLTRRCHHLFTLNLANPKTPVTTLKKFFKKLASQTPSNTYRQNSPLKNPLPEPARSSLMSKMNQVDRRVYPQISPEKRSPFMNRSQRRAAMRLSNQLAAKSSAPVAAAATATASASAAAEPAETPAISPARLAANRANAQLSHGAVTPEGKQRSSMNALKTGLTSRIVVLPTEDAAIYQQHLARIVSDLKPIADRETALVQNIADTEWRLLRIVPLESALYARGREQFAQTGQSANSDLAESDLLLEINIAFEKQFRNLYLQERRLRSQRKEDIAELKAVQQERTAQEQAAAEQRQKDVRRAETILANAAAKNLTYDWSEFGFDFSEAELRAFTAKNTQYVQLAVARLDFDKFLTQYRRAA